MEIQFRIIQEYVDEFRIQRKFKYDRVVNFSMIKDILGIEQKTEETEIWRPIDKYGDIIDYWLPYGFQVPERENEIKFKTLEEAQYFIDNFVQYPIYH